MSVLAAAPLLLRRRSALADTLPVLAFAASTAITSTVLGGLLAFVGRMPADALGPSASGEDSIMGMLAFCALTASVLLVPSAVGFGGAAARLSLARRERDLAAMRLVGGTSAQVGGIALLDVAAQALLGSVLGVLAHLAVTPALTALDFGIAPFTVGELLLPVWAYPLVVLGILLVALGSAAVALAGVVLSPLGVARESRTVRMSLLRLAVWAVLILLLVAATQLAQVVSAVAGPAGMLIIMIVLVGGVVAGVNVVGPLVVWLLARALAATAPTAGLLVAARRLAADPRAAWRTVSGITIALVVAGLLTVISNLGEASTPEDAMLMTAMGTGGLLTLGIAAVLAAISTGITRSAQVIDEMPVLRAQHVAGAQVGQLQRARMLQALLPVLLSSVLAAGTALLVVVATVGASTPDPAALVQYVATVIGAYVLVLGAVAVSAPLVRRGVRI